MIDSSLRTSVSEAARLGRGAEGVVFEVVSPGRHATMESALVELMLAGAPGAELVGLLTEVEAGPLSEDESLSVARAWERVSRWVAARQQQALVRVTGVTECRDAPYSTVDTSTEEARIALGLTPGQVERRTTIARELALRLPLTAAALEAGQISTGHVHVLVDLLEGRSAEVAAQVEARVLVRAPHQALPAFRRCVRRALIRFDPLGEALSHLQAASQRGVVRYDDPDSGLCTLVATMPVLDGLIVWNTLDANARRDLAHDKEQRTSSGEAPGRLPSLSAYRVDTLVRWAQEDLAHVGAPRPQRRPVEVHVVIDLPTLLGLADNPAEIPGHGSLPAPIARLLTEDAQWRRLVTDPVTGHLLDYGHATYTPPQRLRDYVVARDRMCVGPHCERPAHHGQLDHLDAFPRKDGHPDPGGADPPSTGGRTSAANLRPQCAWHHLLKTHHGWDIQARPDSSLLWTSPTGRTYLIPARPVLPD